MGTNYKLEYLQYAQEGIALWINNQPQRSEEHFKAGTENTLVLAGYTFILCINGLISFEMDKIEEAQNMLRELEKRCAAESFSWLSSVRVKLFGGYSPQSKFSTMALENKIILADSYLCSAILTFLTQDISGFVKGSWLLRKSWRLYSSTYNQIYEIFKKTVVDLNCDRPATPPSYTKQHPTRSVSVQFNTYSGSAYDSDQISIISSHHHKHFFVAPNECSMPIDEEQCGSNGNQSVDSKANLNLNVNKKANGFIKQTPLSCPDAENLTSNFNHLPNSNIDSSQIIELMGAISFGYGVFQLSASLLPQNFLRIVSFFGFEGNRNLGVACLMYARKSNDMRSSLATLALLWYYTYGAQLFGTEDAHSQEEIAAATLLLVESEPKYSSSAIFLFFRGRVERLKGSILGAIDAYELSYRTCAQRELKLLCLHEMAWCRLIQLDFENASKRFDQLRGTSVFSKGFYAYMTAICQGASGNFSRISSIQKEVIEIMNKSNQKESQIGKFIIRRIGKFSNNSNSILDICYWKCLVYEILFLWSTMSCVQDDGLRTIITDCLNTTHEPTVGLACLVRGSALTCLKNYSLAIDSYRDCIQKRDELKLDDMHVSAYANYELAVLLLRANEGTKQEARRLLTEAQLIKNYDMENRLNVRIQRELSHFVA